MEMELQRRRKIGRPKAKRKLLDKVKNDMKERDCPLMK